MGSGLWLLSNPFAFADRRRQALFSWVRACGSSLTLLLTHRRAATVVTVNQGALVGRSAREGRMEARRRGAAFPVRTTICVSPTHSAGRTRTPCRAPRPCARSGLGRDTACAAHSACTLTPPAVPSAAGGGAWRRGDAARRFPCPHMRHPYDFVRRALA